jgi:hypothetical protein
MNVSTIVQLVVDVACACGFSFVLGWWLARRQKQLPVKEQHVRFIADTEEANKEVDLLLQRSQRVYDYFQLINAEAQRYQSGLASVTDNATKVSTPKQGFGG